MIVTLEKIKFWVKGLKENKSGAPSDLYPEFLRQFQEKKNIDDFCSRYQHCNIAIVRTEKMEQSLPNIYGKNRRCAKKIGRAS